MVPNCLVSIKLFVLHKSFVSLAGKFPGFFEPQEGQVQSGMHILLHISSKIDFASMQQPNFSREQTLKNIVIIYIFAKSNLGTACISLTRDCNEGKCTQGK